MDDDLFYSGGDTDKLESEETEPWEVLIVDDDDAVHRATRFALGHVTFERRPIRLHHAYGLDDALAAVNRIDDLALVFLDVVMDSSDAGLSFLRFLRTECGNQTVRVVLRTGQPGLAPEERVVAEHDINDYRSKTELSAGRLYSVTVSALRAYRDLRTIERLKDAAYRAIGHEAGLGQQIMEFSTFPTFHTDTLFVLTGCNEAFCRFLGMSKAVLMGAHVEAVLPAGLAAFLQSQTLDDTAVGKSVTSPTEPITVPDGDRRLRLIACAFTEGDGRLGGWLGRLEDAAQPVLGASPLGSLTQR